MAELGTLSLERLFTRAAAGEDPAVDELMRRFDPLARSVARRYQPRGETLDDLLQIARLGLLQAIRRYDPDRGVAFTSFAMPTMLGELKRHFRDSSWAVHVPRSVKEQALRLGAATDTLTSRLGRSPSIAELAAELQLSQEQTLEALEAHHGRYASPLETPGDDPEAGGPLSPVQTIGVEDEGLEHAEYRGVIARGVSALSEADRELLRLRFEQDLTQSEIARRIGTSQMQVSRRLRAAVERIRLVSGELDPPSRAGDH